jgi:2-iminoacetate synthase ThiH
MNKLDLYRIGIKNSFEKQAGEGSLLSTIVGGAYKGIKSGAKSIIGQVEKGAGRGGEMLDRAAKHSKGVNIELNRIEAEKLKNLAQTDPQAYEDIKKLKQMGTLAVGGTAALYGANKLRKHLGAQKEISPHYPIY